VIACERKCGSIWETFTVITLSHVVRLIAREKDTHVEASSTWGPESSPKGDLRNYSKMAANRISIYYFRALYSEQANEKETLFHLIRHSFASGDFSKKGSFRSKLYMFYLVLSSKFFTNLTTISMPRFDLFGARCRNNLYIHILRSVLFARPGLIQERLKRTETHLIHFKWGSV